MNNTEYPIKRVVINELTVDDFGMYQDTETSLYHLLFKKYGFSMVDDGSAGIASAVKDCSFYGSATSVVMVLNPECPCDECNYEYGFQIREKVQHPGVQNYDYVPTMHSYGGELETVTCSGGYITDAQKLIMEDDIITQMKDSEMEYSFTEGRRFYKVTDTNVANNSTLVVTYENGTTSTVTASAHAANQLVDAINADATANLVLFAFATDENEVFVTTINPGVLFTLTAGTTTTVDERGIWISAKKDAKGLAKSQFDVLSFESFATVKGLTFYKLDGSNFSSANQASLFTYDSNGAVTATTIAGASLSTVRNNILGVTGVYSNLVAATDIIYVYMQSTLSDMVYKPLYTGNITITDDFSKLGKFPNIVTGEQVFKEFAFDKNLGDSSTLIWLDQVNPNADYCKYVFNMNLTGLPAEHGASHKNDYVQKVILYIKKDYLHTDFWDASDYMWDISNASYTADTTFDELIEAWSGITVNS